MQSIRPGKKRKVKITLDRGNCQIGIKETPRLRFANLTENISEGFSDSPYILSILCSVYFLSWFSILEIESISRTNSSNPWNSKILSNKKPYFWHRPLSAHWLSIHCQWKTCTGNRPLNPTTNCWHGMSPFSGGFTHKCLTTGTDTV